MPVFNVLSMKWFHFNQLHIEKDPYEFQFEFVIRHDLLDYRNGTVFDNLQTTRNLLCSISQNQLLL